MSVTKITERALCRDMQIAPSAPVAPTALTPAVSAECGKLRRLVSVDCNGKLNKLQINGEEVRALFADLQSPNVENEQVGRALGVAVRLHRGPHLSRRPETRL